MKTIEEIKNQLQKILIPYNIYLEDYEDGSDVLFAETTHDSLTDLVNDLVEIEEILGNSELAKYVSLDGLKSFRHNKFDVFTARHNFIEDSDHAWLVYGDESMEEIAEEWVSNREDEFESEDAKLKCINNIKSELKMNSLDGLHVQYYTEPFDNFDRSVKLFEGSSHNYFYENSGNAGSKDENRDFYSLKPAFVFFKIYI